MTTLDEAIKTILQCTHPLEIEEKPLAACIGQVLAEDAYSDVDLPRNDRSSPDGYAVRAADIRGATRDNAVTLRIIGTARAGFVSKRRVLSGTAMRIMTGSVLPEGADCVVRFEDTDEPPEKNGSNPANPRTVKIFVAGEVGTNIGFAGFSARKDSLVIAKGTVIGGPQLSVLTTMGRATVKVVRRPVVAIIATGDELVALGRRLSPGQTYNSNAGAVGALVAHYGAIPKILGVARDKESSLLARLQKGLAADAIITTGGVSKGDYDIVRLVLGKMGEVLFSRIAMGPGASVAFGVIDDPSRSSATAQIPVFALSGPPSGALINCETLVRPGLLKMRGLTDVKHPTVLAEAADPVSRKMPKSFARWTRLTKNGSGHRVTLNPTEGIGPLATMAAANSLTIIREGTSINAGDSVEVLPLDWMGIQSIS